MQKFKVSYDEENDDLMLMNPKSKSKGSIEIGGIILDFNIKKELIGIQIMEASEIIANMVEEIDSQEVMEILKKLKTCNIDIISKNNMVIVKMFIKDKLKQFIPTLSLPTITQTSPALTYA